MAMRTAGWLPKQHGAWAFIVVPYLAGLVMARDARPLGPGDLTLGVTWLAGYFAFNAAVLAVKAPPVRRERYVPALGVYLTLALVVGLVTLALKGWALLLWLPPYGALLLWALRLAATHRERSVLSGMLTVVASCGLMVVLQPWLADDPTRSRDVAMMIALTGYFAGTVLHVKALIRDRNDPTSARRSQVYHAVLAAAVTAAAVLGWLGWWWVFWAMTLVLRSFWMPRARRRPAQIGVGEVLLSAWALALTLAG